MSGIPTLLKSFIGWKTHHSVIDKRDAHIHTQYFVNVMASFKYFLKTAPMMMTRERIFFSFPRLTTIKKEFFPIRECLCELDMKREKNMRESRKKSS